MTNPYYTETFTAAQGSQGRSRAVDAQFVLIQQAFDLLYTQLLPIIGTSGQRFTQLLDAPSSYTGQALSLVRVNAAGSALEFVGPGGLTVKVVAGTTYTLLASDKGKLLIFSNSSAVTVTVPPDVFSQGDMIFARQGNAGQVTFAEGSGVTVNSSDNLMSTRTQHAQVALQCDDDNVFCLIGERDAPSLSYAVLTGGNAFTGAQTVAFQALTDAATINTDAGLSNHFSVTLGGNRTLANPTNMRDGGIYNWRVKQDGTGSRTLSYGSKFKWPSGVAPVLSTAASAVDRITGQYHAADDVIECVCTKAFA